MLGGGAYTGSRQFGDIGVDDSRLEGLLLRTVSRFDLTVAMGSRAKSFLVRNGVKRVTVIPGGVDWKIFSSETRPTSCEYDIITVARLDPVKRLDVLLEVVCELNKRRRVTAAIVGSGPLRAELEKMAERLGVRDRIIFAGYQANVSEWLRRSRIFVLTSDSEGLSLAVMEALVMGLPIVTSRVGDIEDIVSNGINGYLAAPGATPTFVDRIMCLLDNEERRMQFGAAASQAASEVSVETSAGKWDRALESLGFGT